MKSQNRRKQRHFGDAVFVWMAELEELQWNSCCYCALDYVKEQNLRLVLLEQQFPFGCSRGHWMSMTDDDAAILFLSAVSDVCGCTGNIIGY